MAKTKKKIKKVTKKSNKPTQKEIKTLEMLNDLKYDSKMGGLREHIEYLLEENSTYCSENEEEVPLERQTRMVLLRLYVNASMATMDFNLKTYNLGAQITPKFWEYKKEDSNE